VYAGVTVKSALPKVQTEVKVDFCPWWDAGEVVGEGCGSPCAIVLGPPVGCFGWTAPSTRAQC
jgi:hypothetical protein